MWIIKKNQRNQTRLNILKSLIRSLDKTVQTVVQHCSRKWKSYHVNRHLSLFNPLVYLICVIKCNTCNSFWIQTSIHCALRMTSCLPVSNKELLKEERENWKKWELKWRTRVNGSTAVSKQVVSHWRFSAPTCSNPNLLKLSLWPFPRSAASGICLRHLPPASASTVMTASPRCGRPVNKALTLAP